MAQARTVRLEHRTRARSAAGPVYRLLADHDNWPRIFPPFVHLENLGPCRRNDALPVTLPGCERIAMWSVSGDAIEHWVALRRKDERALRIDFHPEAVEPPLESICRTWTVREVSGGECVIGMECAFSVRGDDAATLASVRDAVAEGAAAELLAVRIAAELEATFPQLLLDIEDSVPIEAPASAVYDFLYAAHRWPERIPEVLRAEVREGPARTQILELDTRESDGRVLTTKAARVGIAHRKIAVKQLLLSPIGSHHHVQWLIDETPDGTLVTARQKVVIQESGVAAVLGPGTDLAGARSFVRRELSEQARMILDQARFHMERD